ncbi:hypothetical protein HYC85_008884 [Camellia sinensis]|uniref:Uncharacterized protein n=1 Tax=Camellia sinensis TaxID=4442 RepID=A0A7J7HVQ1_CAMSI|nr:hypothetical protein HYC85_008884 [Camellia sinensis]
MELGVVMQGPVIASQAWMEWLMKKRKAFDQRGDMAVAAWAEQQQCEMNLRVRHLSRSKVTNSRGDVLQCSHYMPIVRPEGKALPCVLIQVLSGTDVTPLVFVETFLTMFDSREVNLGAIGLPTPAAMTSAVNPVAVTSVVNPVDAPAFLGS